MEGILIKGFGGFYFVRLEDEIYTCSVRGTLKQMEMKPTTGDKVVFQETGTGEGVITGILTRKNSFIRPPVANVEKMVVVISATKPEPKLSILDRFLVMAESKETEIVICLNKIDMVSKEIADSILAAYKDIYPTVPVSADTGKGIETLASYMREGTVAMIGPSGVGKSTLLNLLHPPADAKTGEISSKTGRGRHTTRHVELFNTKWGGWIYDTPGFTSFDVPCITEEALARCFPEIYSLSVNCKYNNCRHVKEPGCSVIAGVASGKVGASRYKSYLDQIQEIRKRRNYE